MQSGRVNPFILVAIAVIAWGIAKHCNLSPAGVFSPVERAGVSEPCADHVIVKSEAEEGQQERWWVLEKGFLASSVVFDSQKFKDGMRVERIACDRLNSYGQESVRIDVWTGGMHCCSNSYWFDPSGKRVYYIDFGHGENDPTDNVMRDNLGNAFYGVRDASLAYFNAEAFFLPFVDTVFLPFSVCVSGTELYDCTTQTVSLEERIERLEKILKASVPKAPPLISDANREFARKVVEYVAINALAGFDDYKLELARLGLGDEVVEKIEGEVFKNLPKRKDLFIAYPLIATDDWNRAIIVDLDTEEQKEAP